MRKIRIAQIGTNRYSHAPEVFIMLKTMTDLFDVVGYALVEDERETCANKMYAFDGYPELTLEQILKKFACHVIMNIHLKTPDGSLEAYDEKQLQKLIDLIVEIV